MNLTQKQQRELTRARKSLGSIHMPGYMAYLLTILSMVYIVDEIASNINSALQSDMVTQFYVNGMGLEFNTGLAAYSAMTAPLYACMLITPFYKSLADRYGRKLFLALNTFGMGLGMLICMLAPSPIFYLLGIGIINFLMNNDMQVLYIMESAPEKHRAKITSITKAIALLGVMVIPVLRDLFLLEDGTGWQKVFLIPAIGGMAMGIFSLLAMPETPVYLKRRIHALENPGEAPAAKQKTPEQSQGGVVDALKFIFAHKQMRSLALCAFIFVASTGGTNYYESIMKTGGMTTGQITTAMFFIPPVNAAMTAISGFITDRLGRKRSVLVHTAIALLGLVCFVGSASLGLAPMVVGISYGFFIGGLWSAADILFILLPGESTPTNLRVSVVGTMGIMSGIGNVISVAIMVVGMLFIESIGLLYLCVAVPFMLLSAVILITKVNETQDVDLSTVTGSEWD